MSFAGAYDVIVLGSGIAGLAAGLAAHENGLRPVLIEKADQLGGTTADSYGLIWVGGNHLMRQAGESDTRDEIIRYRTFLGGGELCEARMLALVDRSPEAVEFFESCGIPFRLTGGIVDHYLGVAPGARGSGTLEAELISGFELGAWRDNVRTPRHAPYFVTAEEQYEWGGINRYSTWDQARAALTRIAGFFAKLRTTAEQLTALERWYRILSQALKKFLRGRNLVLPRQLRPAGAASYG